MKRLERVTRLELATSSLARRCSTTELHPHADFWRRAIMSGDPSGASGKWVSGTARVRTVNEMPGRRRNR